MLNKVDRITSQYRLSGKKTLEEFLTPDELTAVKAELADAVRIGEEKIQIANHSYEVVDKHIRRLDQDLKKFEEELERERVHQEQLQEQALIAMGKPKKRKRCGRARRCAPTPRLVLTHAEKTATRAAARRHAPHATAVPRVPVRYRIVPAFSFLTWSVEQFKNPDYDSDLPVDPNEPTYCHCNRVSYGEMVGCDNDNVRPPQRVLIVLTRAVSD